ncbi:hypothetical protein DFH09DRAFT_1362492 [Mycena vulgaris]|nr:hypothetical protein DFH09DRAFT_1362492 [Mycena vulgaris]
MAADLDAPSVGGTRIRIERHKHHDLRQNAPATTPATQQGARGASRILREKTQITTDGGLRQKRSVVEVTAASEARAAKTGPDIRKQRAELIYDYYDGAEGGGDEDRGRDLRESDDPLRQWAEDHLEQFLVEMLRLEGRGEHRDYPMCAACLKEAGDHRCAHCINGGQLLCAGCMVAAHWQLPFHQIQHWTGSTFERKTLKAMGLRIQLGHWHGHERRCVVPMPAPGGDFVVVDTHGVHEVGLDYCGCGMGGAPTVQLLQAKLYPAITTNPRTAATFSVLRRFHLLSFESKCSGYEFYQSLARETDNMRHKEAKPTKSRKGSEPSGEAAEEREKNMKDQYHEFLQMTREWRHLQMLKRAACGHNPEGAEPGACSLLCPACPQPEKNLPEGWKDVPEERQFLYALFLAMDANFRLKRKDVSTEEKDPGLGKGWAFFCEVKKYMTHVKAFWHEKQERSHCVAHDAVDKPDREARGTASSGIGAVDCARHNMKRPNAVGDLQLGERYLNMDYMFFRSIVGSPLVRFFVSYDIACQWHINIWNRMIKYDNEELTIDGAGKFMTFLVPKFHLPAHIEACNLKFSFNLTRDVGQTDGEAPERGWADANPLASSTKEMGPGSRRDTLEDHFNDWNHKKIIALGYIMRRKIRNAVPQMVETKAALGDMEDSLGPEPLTKWREMAEQWEKDGDAPNPFEMLRRDEHVAKVRRDLAEEAAAREEAGEADAGDVRGDMHITELVGMGLQLEDQQRVIAFDMAATGLHPTDNQRRAMIERTSKLRRKIFAWIEVQTKFFPQLARLRDLEDEARARIAETQVVPGIKVSDISLWLPSTIASAAGPDAAEVVVRDDVRRHEYRLRVGQAGESLDELRRLLLIAALNNQVKRAAAQYRDARRALGRLGKVLKTKEWEWSFLDLKEEDIRGLPRATFGDPEWQMGKKKKKRSKAKKARLDRQARELSWIWINRGARYEPGDDRAMNEAVRIEWAKARARCGRWREEVDLLEEEMRRIPAFLLWRADWWKEQVGRRGLSDGPQLEGETAYALRQASLQAKLAARFMKEWEAVPELIQLGRQGELQEERDARVDSDADSEGDELSSDDEEEAIPSLPERELRSSYVDEVLAM